MTRAQSAAGRSDEALSNPDVITQLWNDFADIGALESHVVEVEGLEPETVAHTVTVRWQATALVV